MIIREDPAYKLLKASAEQRAAANREAQKAARSLAASLRQHPAKRLAYSVGALRKGVTKLNCKIQRVLADLWGEL
ncbi:hypothetical protein MACH18_12440 [Phaeobacter italicus]|nr:hypothetical protein MACH18_12440 [Phaeobacter italicus]